MACSPTARILAWETLTARWPRLGVGQGVPFAPLLALPTAIRNHAPTRCRPTWAFLQGTGDIAEGAQQLSSFVDQVLAATVPGRHRRPLPLTARSRGMPRAAPARTQVSHAANAERQAEGAEAGAYSNQSKATAPSVAYMPITRPVKPQATSVDR